MPKQTVVHNGVEVAEGWPERIENAQSQRVYQIEGRTVARISYGKEADDWGAEQGLPCHDCGEQIIDCILLTISAFQIHMMYHYLVK